MRRLLVVFCAAVFGHPACDVFLDEPGNQTPTANAGADRKVWPGQTVVLDGSASSDPDGDPLSFQWEIASRPAGATATIDDAQSTVARLEPDTSGVWVVRLVVSDGKSASEPDEISITVEDGCTNAQDCGPGAWQCIDHQCSCDRAACADGFCPPEGWCCTADDCGTGAWFCEEHQCGCATAMCDDGRCPEAGTCCRAIFDDDRCGPDAVCEEIDGETACVSGENGVLVIDGTNCLLDGSACPATVIENPDAGIPNLWLLKDNTLRFTSVTVSGNAILTAPAIDAAGQGGRLQLDATGTVTIATGSRVDMSGRGWGGGGGGGGIQYCANEVQCKFGTGGGTGYEDPDGEPGGQGDALSCLAYQDDTVGSGSGGAGGGQGGEPGQNGGGCESRCPDPPYPLGGGSGGRGGGPFGGAGGTDLGYSNKCSTSPHCDDVEGPGGSPPRYEEVPAESGERGGYATARGNGDTSTDASVLIGSGGGGGAGGIGSSGWCCGSADGGAGGVPGCAGFPGCVGGGGGGGGGAGGGAIEIRAKHLVVEGDVAADGAGHANLFSGYGAGGGILLFVRGTLTIDGTIHSLGGFGDGTGSPINGGTVKLYYREFEGTKPDVLTAGRVFDQQLVP